MSWGQGNAPGDQGFGFEYGGNYSWQLTLEKMQQEIEKQNQRLEQQDRRIYQLDQYTKKLEKEHNQLIEFHQLQTQQFTMHIQSHQLRIQQLFAMQTGGPEKHAYGPPPPPNMIQYPVPQLLDMSQCLIEPPRRERNRLRRNERNRSHSPGRGTNRYPSNRREDRSHLSGGLSSDLSGLMSRGSRQIRGMNAAGSTGDENSLKSIPVRLRGNSRTDEGEVQQYFKEEPEEIKVKREMDE